MEEFSLGLTVDEVDKATNGKNANFMCITHGFTLKFNDDYHSNEVQ